MSEESRRVVGTIAITVGFFVAAGFYLDFQRAAGTAPTPPRVRMAALDCPAPTEPELLVITVKHRDGRLVSDCVYVRGSDSARRRP